MRTPATVVVVDLLLDFAAVLASGFGTEALSADASALLAARFLAAGVFVFPARVSSLISSLICCTSSLLRGASWTICFAGLSLRKLTNDACRTMPSPVHSAKLHSATRSGFTQCTGVRLR